MDALSCVYYEYNNDGLPTKQQRRGAFDVDRHCRILGLRLDVREILVG
jgi:hypothetical protein